MRSRLLLVGIAVTVLVAAPAASGTSLSDSPVVPEFNELRQPLFRVDESQTNFTEVSPLHLPAPGQANGIGPGSHLIIRMDDEPGVRFGCTANFIWSGAGVAYLGSAGHCFLPEDRIATHGVGADYNPARTHVQVCVSNCQFGGQTGFIMTGNLVDLGPVAYARQTDPTVADDFDKDVGNDFGIVSIPAALQSQVRPSMPVWGGPSAVEEVSLGSVVCFYGNAAVLGEVWPSMARAGVGGGTEREAGRWLINAPTFQGDSGSALQVCASDSGGVHGRGAAGILTHLVVAAGSATGVNFVAGTTVAKAIQLASQAGLSISVVPGS